MVSLYSHSPLLSLHTRLDGFDYFDRFVENIFEDDNKMSAVKREY